MVPESVWGISEDTNISRSVGNLKGIFGRDSHIIVIIKTEAILALKIRGLSGKCPASWNTSRTGRMNLMVRGSQSEETGLPYTQTDKIAIGACKAVSLYT